MTTSTRFKIIYYSGIGCLLLVILFIGYNKLVDFNAGRQSASAVIKLNAIINNQHNQDFDDSSTENTPLGSNGTFGDVNENLSYEKYDDKIVIDGTSFIGVLDIPDLNLSLPIQSDWSYDKLYATPCAYSGSVDSNLIIAGHDYKSHFANLSQLSNGDIVRFTDINAVVHTYTLTTSELIYETEINKLVQEGDWDLTLFTCDKNDSKRLVIRFKKQY